MPEGAILATKSAVLRNIGRTVQNIELELALRSGGHGNHVMPQYKASSLRLLCVCNQPMKEETLPASRSDCCTFAGGPTPAELRECIGDNWTIRH